MSRGQKASKQKLFQLPFELSVADVPT